MKAHQQYIVYGRADLAVRRLDQAPAKVARGEVDAVDVAGDPPPGGGDHQAGGVGILATLWVERVLEPGCAGEPPDRRFVAGQEVPPSFHPRAVVPFQIARLLDPGQV